MVLDSLAERIRRFLSRIEAALGDLDSLFPVEVRPAKKE